MTENTVSTVLIPELNREIVAFIHGVSKVYPGARLFEERIIGLTNQLAIEGHKAVRELDRAKKDIERLEAMHRGVCESNKRLRAELGQVREEAINAAIRLGHPRRVYICENLNGIPKTSLGPSQVTTETIIEGEKDEV